MAPPVAQLKPLPFSEAIAAFRRRTDNPQASDRWASVWQDEHSAQFTVARSIGYDILGDIGDAMDSAIAGGSTYADFAKQLAPVLKAKGWWGKIERPDGEQVQLGSYRRLTTIFNTNMRVSYAAGRWEQIQRSKATLPYLMYSAVLDSRTRPAHRAWHGTVLPVDHPWWLAHYPPCGWNCRCSVIQLTESAARKRGITQTPPSGPPRQWFNPTTGERVQVPYGIDPGWGYNVGVAAEKVRFAEQAAQQMADKLVAVPPEVAARPMPDAVTRAIAEEYATWYDGIDRGQLKGEQRVAGALSQAVLQYLVAIGRRPQSGAITITDRALGHIWRAAKEGLRPTEQAMRALPELLAQPVAVLWDRDFQNLTYVVDVSGDTSTRFVVAVDRSERVRDETTGARLRVTTNAVINGQLVSVESLHDARRYDLIDGAL
jgi:SPP1 gp7 family putative phage head morphogenesis protein